MKFMGDSVRILNVASLCAARYPLAVKWCGMRCVSLLQLKSAVVVADKELVLACLHTDRRIVLPKFVVIKFVLFFHFVVWLNGTHHVSQGQLLFVLNVARTCSKIIAFSKVHSHSVLI